MSVSRLLSLFLPVTAQSIVLPLTYLPGAVGENYRTQVVLIKLSLGFVAR